MSVSRDSILTIIRRNDGANVDDLANEVDLAPATVRRHLDILGRDGLVDHVELRKHTGRPQHVFHLTEKGHDSVPKDYGRLLSELIHDIKNISIEDANGRSGDEILRESLARRLVHPPVQRSRRVRVFLHPTPGNSGGAQCQGDRRTVTVLQASGRYALSPRVRSLSHWERVGVRAKRQEHVTEAWGEG